MPYVERINYQKYLQSDAWRATRRAFLDLQPTPLSCSCCRQPQSEWRSMEVHHLTYDHLGDERYEDLLLACSRCHKIIHSQAERTGSTIAAATEYVIRQRGGYRATPSAIAVYKFKRRTRS